MKFCGKTPRIGTLIATKTWCQVITLCVLAYLLLLFPQTRSLKAFWNALNLEPTFTKPFPQTKAASPTTTVGLCSYSPALLLLVTFLLADIVMSTIVAFAVTVISIVNGIVISISISISIIIRIDLIMSLIIIICMIIIISVCVSISICICITPFVLVLVLI